MIAAAALAAAQTAKTTVHAMSIHRRPALPSGTTTQSRPGPATVTWLTGRTT